MVRNSLKQLCVGGGLREVMKLPLKLIRSGQDVPAELDKTNINFSCSCFLITSGGR